MPLQGERQWDGGAEIVGSGRPSSTWTQLLSDIHLVRKQSLCQTLTHRATGRESLRKFDLWRFAWTSRAC
jgi:hypothetical protein